MLRLAEYATVKVPRLYGLTWGQEDLPAAIGAQIAHPEARGGLALVGGQLLSFRLFRFNFRCGGILPAN